MDITVAISDEDVLVLNNDLLNINDWVQKAVTGKINSARKRMVKEWQPILFNDPSVTSIPATDNELISLVMSRPDYKNRSDKDSYDAKVALRAGRPVLVRLR